MSQYVGNEDLVQLEDPRVTQPRVVADGHDHKELLLLLPFLALVDLRDLPRDPRSQRSVWAGSGQITKR